MERVVTTLPEDSFGVARLLPDYRVESTPRAGGGGEDESGVPALLFDPGWKPRCRWIAGRRIAIESQATLNAMKQAIENRTSELLAQRSDSANKALQRRRGHVALLDFVAHSAPAAAQRCR